jgi:hypothetical protein
VRCAQGDLRFLLNELVNSECRDLALLVATLLLGACVPVFFLC